MQNWGFTIPLLVLLNVAACGAAAPPNVVIAEVSGHLEDSAIREASGLARSLRQPGTMWVINDRGSKEIVHAIDQAGRRLGEFDLKKSRNTDWEDLASFQYHDQPYLMVADIGDNDARHKHRTLYFVTEPIPEERGGERFDWEIRFSYPDGPRDAEAAAIDMENERVLVLSKRDITPQLYEVPLSSQLDTVHIAKKLGDVTTLHRPTRQEREMAPKLKDWFWQPVGMDISADNLAAVILTYRAVYYYQREPGQTWFEALNTPPLRISIGNFKNAEAIAFSNNKRSVIVTGETRHSPLLRIDFNGDQES